MYLTCTKRVIPVIKLFHNNLLVTCMYMTTNVQYTYTLYYDVYTNKALDKGH